MQLRKTYPSAVTDEQWKIIGPLIPKPKQGGAPAKFERREVLNGVLYVLRTGCAWRELPHDLPPWDTVYGYFRRWTKEGLWEWIGERLRDEARPRAAKKKRRPQPFSTAKASRLLSSAPHAATTPTNISKRPTTTLSPPHSPRS